MDTLDVMDNLNPAPFISLYNGASFVGETRDGLYASRWVNGSVTETKRFAWNRTDDTILAYQGVWRKRSTGERV